MPPYLFKTGEASRGVSPEHYDAMTGSRAGPLERPMLSDVTLEDIRHVAMNCNALRKTIDALTDYIFSNGYTFEPAFSVRCRACEHEHDAEVHPDECEKCGMDQDRWEAAGHDGAWSEEPDDDRRKRVDAWFDHVDKNQHALLETCKMFNETLEQVDDAFLVAAGVDYDLDDDGNIVDWDLMGSAEGEVYVPDPVNFKLVAHPKTLEPGQRWSICLSHRPQPSIPGMRDEDARTYDAAGTAEVHHPGEESAELRAGPTTQGRVYPASQDRCTHRLEDGSMCGKRLYDVWYVNTVPYSQGGASGHGHDVIEYYIGPDPETDFPGEVIHTSKYHHSYGYGHSPAYSVYNMATSLMAMERYIRDWYENQRTPRGALFFNADDVESIRGEFEQAENIYSSQGPHGGAYIPKFAARNRDGGEFVKFIDFSNLPEELQFQQVRDEFYRRIGSAYGVSPVFHGNVDAIGLQNQGPTQWQVTKLAAEWGQWIFDEKVFPKLAKWLHLDDWNLELAPVDEQDDLDEMQVKLMKVNEAQQLQQMGFTVIRRAEDGEFEFSEEPDPEALEQAQGGMGDGFGGMFGGGQGGMGVPSPPGGQNRAGRDQQGGDGT